MIGDARARPALRRLLALGAAGIWVGTRFIATPEARSTRGYKEARRFWDDARSVAHELGDDPEATRLGRRISRKLETLP